MTGRLDPGAEFRLAAVLFLALFLASADNQLLIPLIPTIGNEFGLAVAEFGKVFSIYALFAAGFNLLVGPLSDRVGRLPVLRAGLLLFAVMAILTSRTEGFMDLLVVRAGTGIAAGAISTCSAGLIADQVPYQRRGRTMGFVLSSYFGAMVLGVPVSAWVADTWGWRFVFLGSSAIAVLSLMGTFLVSEERPLRPTGAENNRMAGRRSGLFGEFRSLLSGSATRGALLASFATSGGTLAFLTFISGFLSDRFSLSATRISMVFLVSGVAAILASPVSGIVSDRWTKRRVFLVANTLLTIPLLALTALGCGVLLFASVFLISLCISFRQTALQTLQTELIETERRGSFIALRNCASQLGISASVYVAGLLYLSKGYAGVTLLAALLTFAGSAILYFLIPDPGERPGRPRL